MTKMDPTIVSDRVLNRLQLMQETFYWFEEKINVFQHYFKNEPEILNLFRTPGDDTCDLLGELNSIKAALANFNCAIRRGKEAIRWEQGSVLRMSSKDLPADDVLRLSTINSRLEDITDQIGQFATEIGASLDERLNHKDDCLYDYEIDAELSFVLREEDPGYCADSDNILKKLSLPMNNIDGPVKNWEIFGHEYPDGYEFERMPHGRLFHALLKNYDFHSMQPPVGLLDILRIGSVWCDLVVRYQFNYDLTEDKWIKTFAWTNDDRRNNTYVQNNNSS